MSSTAWNNLSCCRGHCVALRGVPAARPSYPRPTIDTRRSCMIRPQPDRDKPAARMPYERHDGGSQRALRNIGRARWPAGFNTLADLDGWRPNRFLTVCRWFESCRGRHVMSSYYPPTLWRAPARSLKPAI